MEGKYSPQRTHLPRAQVSGRFSFFFSVISVVELFCKRTQLSIFVLNFSKKWLY